GPARHAGFPRFASRRLAETGWAATGKKAFLDKPTLFSGSCCRFGTGAHPRLKPRSSMWPNPSRGPTRRQLPFCNNVRNRGIAAIGLPREGGAAMSGERRGGRVVEGARLLSGYTVEK